MAAQGSGVIVYLRPTGPLRACGLPPARRRPFDRESDTVTWILRDLGVYPVSLSDDDARISAL